MTTLAQTNLFDIVGTATIEPKFSEVIVLQDPSQKLQKFDTSKWAKDVRAVYEVMFALYPLFAKKSWIADQVGISAHALSARKSDLKKAGVLMEKRKPEKCNEYEYRLLPPKTEADQLPDNYFPTPTDAAE